MSYKLILPWWTEMNVSASVRTHIISLHLDNVWRLWIGHDNFWEKMHTVFEQFVKFIQYSPWRVYIYKILFKAIYSLNVMECVEIHSFWNQIRDHFIWSWIHPQIIVESTPESQSLNHSFESGSGSLIWLQKDWISTPAH